eukprot:TRINITY_DN927_c0_g1_i12.p2 TRINITY_DN927_c0_g1~~TRINITY_DN927_c0_g1_i12.p2  ORF type:complete len:570 (+),score=211.81 TRINITY_DN927_c0_g1_i12:22-1710(+)
MFCCGSKQVIPKDMSFKLEEHPKCPKGRPVMTIVMDGVGIGPQDEYDAVHVAKTPVLDALMAKEELFRPIGAHGTYVGLPSNGDMGNSEVGHNALGAGRVIKQGAALVDSALATGDMFKGKGWLHIKEKFAGEGTLHMIGLLSDGGVHSRFDQVEKMIKGAVADGCKKLRMHVLLDGRDVPDGSSKQFVADLEKVLDEARAAGVDAAIASGGGRMFVTMDRYEADWSIVERGWNAHVLGEAPYKFKSATEALETLYRDLPKPSDQHLPPFVVVDAEEKPLGAIQDGDAVMTFNFRGDRMIEIASAFEHKEFSAFDRKRYPNVNFAGLMCYDGDLNLPEYFLVSPPSIARTASEYLAANGVRTFACSETQKFGHVTYFWNGNRSDKFDDALEEYVEIPSDNIQFNEKPAMKAVEITDATIAALKSGKFDNLRINYANGDMVGHTGDLKACVESMEVLDREMGRLLKVVEEVGGIYIILADHGNADNMAQRSKKGEILRDTEGNAVPLTSHTLAKVPFILGGNLPEGVKLNKEIDGGLANVCATYVNLLGFQAPADYEPSLLSF